VQNRGAMISSIEKIAPDFNLYTAVTPEHVVTSVNIAHFDYHRVTEQGVGVMVVDVWGWQIIEVSAEVTYDTPQVGGSVQSAPLSDAAQAQAMQSAQNLYVGSGATGVSNLTPNVNSILPVGTGGTPIVNSFATGGAVSGSGPFSPPGPIMPPGSM
jgi:hypothetical protein